MKLWVFLINGQVLTHSTFFYSPSIWSKSNTFMFGIFPVSSAAARPTRQESNQLLSDLYSVLRPYARREIMSLRRSVKELASYWTVGQALCASFTPRLCAAYEGRPTSKSMDNSSQCLGRFTKNNKMAPEVLTVLLQKFTTLFPAIYAKIKMY